MELGQLAPHGGKDDIRKACGRGTVHNLIVPIS
jgi:hypothetical protein